MTVRVSIFRRSIFVLLLLVLFSLVVSSDSITVNSGNANVTIFINDTFGNAVQDVNVTLYNASLGINSTYSFNSQTYSVLTDVNGNASFVNLSIADNYSIRYTATNYYSNHSPAFNISNGVAANVTLNFTIVQDNTAPTIAIVGQSTPNNNVVVQGSSTSFSVAFTPSDDLGGTINTSLYITTSYGPPVYNQSVTVTSGTQTGFTISSITGNGNYSWYLNATDGSGNSKISGPYHFFIDTTQATASAIVLSPGNSQNASQYINMSAFINGTYSEINYVRLYVDDGTTFEDSIESFAGDIVSNVSLTYLIPNSSAGTSIDLKLCYRDVGYGTSEQCTANYPVTVTDNISPEISLFSLDDQYIQSTDFFNLSVDATDSSTTNLNVTVQFFNGTDYVLNQSTTTHTNDVYTFSFAPSTVEPTLLGENYTVNITAKDNFNNTYSNTTWVVIDDTPATVTYAPLSTRHVKQGDVITLLVSVFDNYNVSVDTFTVTADINYSGFTTQTLSYLGGNLWGANITMNYAGDGDLLMNISAIDIADNIGWNDSSLLFADNTPIDVQINTPLAGETFNGTNNVTVALNYTLDETSNTTYLVHGGTQIILPSNAEMNYSFNATYPGKQSIIVSANDSAGNIGSDSVTFYENFLLNATAWLNAVLAQNVNVTSLLVQNTATPDLLNISNSTGNLTVPMDFLFKDGKWLNISSVELFNSELNYNFSVEIENATFVADYEAADGAAIIDFFRIKNFDKLTAENFSLRFKYNVSEFEEIYMCTNDYQSCTAISASCGGSSCYYSDGLKTVVNITSFPATNNYVSFILVNDTIAPTITVTSPANNSEFSDAYNNQIFISLNEVATCSYSVNTTSHGIQTGTINSVATSSISYDLPNPPYINGEHQFNITCSDANANSNTYVYHYNINDSSAPEPTLKSPSINTVFDKGTTSVQMKLVTDEPAVCKYNTSTFTDFAGTLFSSSDNITHTASVTTTDGTSYTYYVRCRDYNNHDYTSYFSFSVSNIEAVVEPDPVPSSGGGIAPTTNTTNDTEVFNSESIYAGPLTAGVATNVTVNDSSIPIRTLGVKTQRSTANTTFTIESFTDVTKFSISALPLQNVYRYIQIKNDQNLNLTELGNYTIEFKIPADWVAEYNLDHKDVLLGRFDEASNTWQLLEKTFIRSDNDFFYYSAVSPAATLFSISHEETSSSNSNVITRDDIEGIDEGTTRKFTSGKLNSNDVMMIVFGFAMVAILGVVGYANRYKLMSIISPSKVRSSKTSNSKKDAKLRNADSKKSASASGTYSEKLPPKLPEITMDQQELSVPNQEVLQKYLFIQFKNIWVKGYNDPSIKKRFIDSNWKKEQLDKAYEIIAADGREYAEPQMVEPKVKQLLDSIRISINEKYGFTKSELHSMLQKNGWPGYMIDSALRALDAEMTVPYDYIQNVSSSELVSYIRSAKDMGASRDVLYQKLTSVGWPEHEVADILNKEFS